VRGGERLAVHVSSAVLGRALLARVALQGALLVVRMLGPLLCSC
jgi:hypothetical protein